jgi:uncharacterized protein YlzI (FlbEa/FlbD family)
MIIKLTRYDGRSVLLNPEAVMFLPTPDPEKGKTFVVGNSATVHVKESIPDIEKLIAAERSNPTL